MSTNDDPSPSRPLPRVRVEQPGAERGADDVRAHLDDDQCELCGAPDTPRVRIEIPWTGKFGRRRVCRGHPDHPDHPGYPSPENPTEYRFCPECGAVARLLSAGVCRACFDPTEETR
jgi:ribosomal protein L37E